MKYTRTAYTGTSIKSVLDELVNATNLRDLPFFEGDLHARPHKEDHPDSVRITITVDRVSRPAKRS